MPIATEMQIFRMDGSDAGQPVPSLYTKGLSPLRDNTYVVACITCMAVYALYVCAYVLYSTCICKCVSVCTCICMCMCMCVAMSTDKCDG